MDYVNTIITSPDANGFFGNFSFFLESKTLEATLRYIALIQNKEEDIEKIKLIKTVHYSNVYKSGNEYAEEDDGGELVVITVGSNPMLSIDKDGWVSLDTPPYPVAGFLSKCSESRVYVNQAKKRTVIIVKTATEKWVEALCSSLFRILPWRWDNRIPENEEREFFKSFITKDGNKFREIINKVCEPYDFKSMTTRRTLLGWGDAYRKQQIKKFQSDIERSYGKIRDLETSISAEYNTLAGYQMNLSALENVAPDDDDRLYKFFQTHKQLGVYRVDQCSSGGKTLYYSVVDTIEYYDKEQYIRAYNNRNSFLYTNSACTEELREIIHAIFGQEKGKIRAESMFKLNNLSSIEAISHTRTDLYGETHLPHPHLYNAACLGSNRGYIEKYMRDGDWDLAIEQTIAATKNVNWGDLGIMLRMISDIGNRMDSCKLIIADNGEAMTPREFLNYVRNQNEDNQNG